MTSRRPIISKTLFLRAHECPRLFWHEVHRPDLIPPLDDAEQARIQNGRLVGELARRAFPGGVMIEPGPDDDKRTAEAMADPGVNVIYEATFRTPGEVVRADVLRRAPDGSWDLIEVKASSRVKDEHKLDVAFQLRLLLENGVQVHDVLLAHPDPDYVREDVIDPKSFFTLNSLHVEAEALQADVERDLVRFHQILASPTPPPETGFERCKCPFHVRAQTPHPIDQLPFLSQKARTKLIEANITDITQIPADFNGLSERQMRVRDAVVNGAPYFDHETLAREFANFVYPIHFIDFETFQPPIPMYRGTRPFQTVPFQWSLHSLGIDGSIKHAEFLHTEETVPFRAFGESLLDALGDAGTVVVYSSHEREILKSLIPSAPDLRDEILAVIDRQVDLLKVMRANVYYPEFHGSYSLKKILPVLVPDLGYDDLAIRNGAHAAAIFEELLREGMRNGLADERCQALLAYCCRDTEALLRIYQALHHEIQRRRPMLIVPRKPAHAGGRRR